jgi:hypothetical protein
LNHRAKYISKNFNMAYEDWAELDEEALEETAAAAPDSLTEQQRLLLGQYNIAHTTESEPITDLGTANPQESLNDMDPSEETDWAELDEEALDEAAAAPEESLTEQQRLCLARRIESQLPIELEDADEAEEAEDEDEADAEDKDEVEAEIEDEEAWTPVPNAKTDQNVLWQEDDQQILCPWKKWIYDEDNSIAIVQGDGHIKKPSHRWDAYRPSRSSVLRTDITDILKIRETLNRNPHLRNEKHEQSSLSDYSQAHLHDHHRTNCQLRGSSPLRQVTTLDMSGIKLIFDRTKRSRNVNAWQHNQNRSQPRLHSPLRQFSCADPDIDKTTESEPVTDLGIANPQSSANNTDSSGEMDWAELDEEALEETAAAAPDTLTEQQRLLLGLYDISTNSKLGSATDLGTTELQQPANSTVSPEETDWANLELDEEFLEETLPSQRCPCRQLTLKMESPRLLSQMPSSRKTSPVSKVTSISSVPGSNGSMTRTIPSRGFKETVI